MTPRASSARRGFTLIEVIITLCIFCMLAAAVFSIFSATLKSDSSLHDNQSLENQSEALTDFLKQNLSALPAAGSMQVYLRDTNVPTVVGVMWGSGFNWYAADPQIQPNSYYTLWYTAYVRPTDSQITDPGSISAAFLQQVMAKDPTLVWRPLMKDLKSVTWQFRDFNAVEWINQINGAKPLLAEFSFQPAATQLPVTQDIWIPPIQTAMNAAAQPAVHPTP